MVDKIRHVDLYFDEFLAGVAGELSAAELGVYWMVCLLSYSRNGPIKDDLDWLQRRFRRDPSNRVVGPALERLIAMGKITRECDELVVSRCREEIERVLSRIRASREHGARGGRPSKVINAVEKGSGSDARVNTNPQQPTERNKPNGLSKSAHALSSVSEITKAMMAVFREVCTSLAPPSKLTEPRQRHCRARLAELGGDIDQWRALCQRVQQSPMLTGLKTDWRADFDWLLQPTNFTKVLEGKYDLNPQGGLHELQLSEEERRAGLAEARRRAGLREPLNG
jgi:hypothetical protein